MASTGRLTKEDIAKAVAAVRKEIAEVIIGQNDVVEQALIGLFSRGHVLLVGVPGLAKTLLVKTIADALDLDFSRIQFTPDLMPADITGSDIFVDDPKCGRIFQFIKGPVFANVILADEINRTPPKTQAALLQSMQELQVTAGGRSYPLEPPFFVLATQNPIEQEGTYPLPEAQLDRFMLEILLDYPSLDEEIQIVKETTIGAEPSAKTVLKRERILEIQEAVRGVPVADHVVGYAVELARKTRPEMDGAPEFVKKWVSWGAGPRASQFLILGAKARALINSANTATVEDVRALAVPVLRHRIIPNFSAEAEGVKTDNLIAQLLDAVKPPSGKLK